jgi:hypothetical protein
LRRIQKKTAPKEFWAVFFSVEVGFCSKRNVNEIKWASPQVSDALEDTITKLLSRVPASVAVQ